MRRPLHPIRQRTNFRSRLIKSRKQWVLYLTLIVSIGALRIDSTWCTSIPLSCILARACGLMYNLVKRPRAHLPESLIPKASASIGATQSEARDSNISLGSLYFSATSNHATPWAGRLVWLGYLPDTSNHTVARWSVVQVRPGPP